MTYKGSLWTLAAAFILALSSNSSATIIHVPADMPTIQAGIDAAEEGDTALVARGTYVENIIYNGMNITVASNFILTKDQEDIRLTVIDGSQPTSQDTGTVVRFFDGETRNAVLQRFTITGGTGTVVPGVSGGTWREGGGIHARDASPTIKNNWIIHNRANSFLGGG